MKKFKMLRYITAVGLIVCFTGCEDYLEEEVYSQLAPDNFLATEDGITSVLGAAYRTSMFMRSVTSNRTWVAYEEAPTDILWSSGSRESQIGNFSWDPASIDFGYSDCYQGIGNANIVLKYLDGVEDISTEIRDIIGYEARFVRAYAYFQLYQLYGPVPLRTSPEQELELARAPEEELLAFIESEFEACIQGLPDPGNELQYGRAHKAAAMAYLSDLYMATHRWEEAAAMAKEIMDLGVYGLYPNYADMFKVENERNEEYIWIRTAKANADRTADNELLAVSVPGDFESDPGTGLVHTGWQLYGSDYRLHDSFVNSFHPDDLRSADCIMKSYYNTAGDFIQLLGRDESTSVKYRPDPNSIGRAHGNDIPAYRYAEILLFRAEALNEMNGPNQESIDLINEVRARAKAPLLELTDFATKESLRDHILQERGWEFFSEGKRRHDLIRMGKFIENAHARGITHAQPYQVLYPIPQDAIDANPKLVQNEGY